MDIGISARQVATPAYIQYIISDMRKTTWPFAPANARRLQKRGKFNLCRLYQICKFSSKPSKSGKPMNV
jgi:hypothetical protein